MSVDHIALQAAQGAQKTPLRHAAVALEGAFLAELLKASGLHEQAGGGESPFASFLVSEHARILAEHGGIGLSEQIFQSLVRAEG